jgi:hypothetical protein
MFATWMHNGDPLWPLFVARILILAAAIGMGALVFGLGALVVRGLDAARVWSARRSYGGVGLLRRQRAMN